MGGSSGSQQTQQQTVSQPWQPAQPELQNILSSLGGINMGVTPGQTSGLNALQGAAGAIPGMGPQVGNVANQYLSGQPNALGQGAYNQASGALSPFLQSNFLNPMSNPFTGQAMGTLNQDLTNQITSQFAGAGQGFGPAEAQALARGLGQGESGVLMNQFNQNAGLAQSAAAQQMASALGLNTANLGNSQFGLTAANATPGAYLAGPAAQYASANAAYNTPLANIGGVAGLTLPIAGLGGQTNSQGASNTQYNPSPLTQMQQGVQMAPSIFGFLGL